MILTLLFFDNAKPVSDKIRFLNAFAFVAVVFIAGYSYDLF